MDDVSHAPMNEAQKQTLDAYRILLDFQKWTYDTYQRDFNYFLAIEILLLGAVGNAISVKGLADTGTTIIAVVGSLLGMFLTVCWAGRQRREFYMAKTRLERLKTLEASLPPVFSYFGGDYLKAREYCGDPKRRRLPLLGDRFTLVPNLYRQKTFLYSIALQQGILFAWIGLVVSVVVRALIR
jgi:hypothetical protein